MLHQTEHAPDPTNHSSTSALSLKCIGFGLKLPHLIPPIIIPLQRETRCALSEVHWIYGTAISPPTPPIIIPLPRKAVLNEQSGLCINRAPPIYRIVVSPALSDPCFLFSLLPKALLAWGSYLLLTRSWNHNRLPSYFNYYFDRPQHTD